MSDVRKLAEAVRRACLEGALLAYEDAGLQGLCQAGRWECAVEAIRELDLEAVLEAHPVAEVRPERRNGATIAEPKEVP